ncbi:MAG: Type 1 glutamine amidotransferase-like domain-containing protein [Lachnospiraceae bacterium]|nr:Type 1 glutamine amidotransferase-like domain-containing protein [Lachnospiraceae bacterium]
MKVFLCGGGSGIQTTEAYKRLNEVINHSKPCLYVPLAMEQEMYDSCYDWIKEELKNINIPSIEMVRRGDELANKNMMEYSMLFIGGGNTFKLLNDLKVSGAFTNIKKYMDNGGVIFGSSAGAIIFGEDLESCRLDDANEVNLNDISGFDVLNGVSVLCHYMNNTAEKDEQSKGYLLELSKHRKVVALPEEVTLFINDNKMEVIGDNPYYYFENGLVTRQRGTWPC